MESTRFAKSAQMNKMPKFIHRLRPTPRAREGHAQSVRHGFHMTLFNRYFLFLQRQKILPFSSIYKFSHRGDHKTGSEELPPCTS